MEEIKQMSRSDNVNFVKFIAAIMVIIGHSFVIATRSLASWDIFLNSHIAFGAIGVAVFFFF